MSKTITVRTEDGPVIVKKVTLGDIADVVKAIQKLPKELLTFIKGSDEEYLKNKDNIIANLPTLIGDAWSDFAGIVAVATDKDKEFIQKLSLADSLDIIDALLELNDYSRMIATIKKIMARKATQTNLENPVPEKQ